MYRRQGYAESNVTYPIGQYMQMSHIPWCTYPLKGTPGLPACDIIRNKYPSGRFYVPPVPKSCEPCKYSIYQTGNAENPNLYPDPGIMSPKDFEKYY